MTHAGLARQGYPGVVVKLAVAHIFEGVAFQVVKLLISTHWNREPLGYVFDVAQVDTATVVCEPRGYVHACRCSPKEVQLNEHAIRMRGFQDAVGRTDSIDARELCQVGMECKLLASRVAQVPGLGKGLNDFVYALARSQ